MVALGESKRMQQTQVKSRSIREATAQPASRFSLPGPGWFLAAVDRHPAWFFVSPALIVLLLLSIFPFIYSLALSFHQWNLSDRNAGWSFVGFANYLRILTGDPRSGRRCGSPSPFW